MDEIAVIVPVYRVEKYLSRCVRSVLRQTFSNFKLVLVDDGSPDSCPKLCDAYGEKDSRIHVIHQKNAGLSAARNAGLDYVMERPEIRWVFFLDSDDWIHEQTLELLHSASVRQDTWVSACGYQLTKGENPVFDAHQLEPQLHETRALYLRETVLMTVACAKLCRKECFREIRYPVGKLHEDEYTTYRVLFQQEKISYIPAPLYAYYENPESITKRKWNVRRLESWQAFREQIAYFEQRQDRVLADHCLRRYLYNAYSQYLQIQSLEDPRPYAENLKIIRKEIDRLILAAQKRNCLDFDEDFALLHRMYPVKTNLKMYGRAALQRLKGMKNA